MTLRVFAIALVTLGVVAPGHAQWREFMKELGVGNKAGVSDKKIGSGLKEALKISSVNAVKLTGRTDGYFQNKAIKILMPEKLQTLEKGLRLVGYGTQVDQFVLSMNRSAEKAAPFAKDIFLNAIGEMSFDDAKKVLAGGNTAATDYFKDKTAHKLEAAFRPAVEKTMNQFQLTRQYKDLVGRYENIPFANRIAFDVDQYVVTNAIDGLFHVLAQEEKKIRTEPAARVTDLLKDVFGNS